MFLREDCIWRHLCAARYSLLGILFKFPALEGGDLGVGDNYFIEKLF